MQFTTEKVAQDYLNLAHPNPQIREQANMDLLQFKVGLPAASYPSNPLVIFSSMVNF